MKVYGFMGLAAAAFIAAAATVTAQDKPARTVWDGVYTAMQAETGGKVYADNCAACHGAEMKGGPGAPALSGPEFQFSWDKKTVGQLFDYAKMFMPPGQQGTLNDEQYTQIVAALLKDNGFPAADSPLPTTKEEMDGITILTTKP
jgi:mono/diheme cytochrome c family protein